MPEYHLYICNRFTHTIFVTATYNILKCNIQKCIYISTELSLNAKYVPIQITLTTYLLKQIANQKHYRNLYVLNATKALPQTIYENGDK